MVNESANVKVTLNSQEAQRELEGLQAQMKRLVELKKKAEKAGDVSGWKKIDGELKKVNREANKLQKEYADIEKTLKNLNGASLNDLQKAKRQLTAEINKLNRNTDEYAKKSQQLKKVKAEISGIYKETSATATGTSRLVNMAKGLLPAFSFAAISAAAIKAFGKIKSATDTLGTQWDVFIGGMKGATDEFFRTIAAGDWSHFLTNMKEAIRVGREYQIILDDLQAKNRALSLIEADYRMEILETEDVARNVSLSDEVRKKAAERRIEIEEELAKKRTQIARQNYEAELMLTTQQTRLSKERLLEVLKDIDSETKAQAEAYNEQIKQYESLQFIIKQQSVGASPELTKKRQEELQRLKAEIDGASDAVKLYAEALAGTGKTTDEQLDRMVKSYNDLKNAEVSALQNTTTVRRRLYTLLKDEGKKTGEGTSSSISEGNFSNAKTALESAFAKEQSLLKQQLYEKKLTKEQFNQEEYILELAHLTAMRELYRNYSEDFIQVENQIFEKKLAWQQQFDEMMAASAQLSEQISADERKMFADIDAAMDEHLNNYIENLDKDTQATIKAELKKTEAREKGKEAALLAAYETGMAAAENAKTIEDAGKVILNVIRDEIKAYLAKAVAAQVMKILSKVPPPLGPILAAAATAAVIVAFNKLVPEFYEGGFTSPGAKHKPAGIVHAGEYVIPQEGVENPALRPVIDWIEIGRRNGELRRLDLGPIVQAIQPRQYASGGYVSSPASTPSSSVSTSNTTPANNSAEVVAAIKQLSIDIQNLKVYAAIETIEKERKRFIKIQQTRGL
ncbi:MAG TPA: hypothetical protein ENN90_15190 [Mariniphaga anaerophila]|uniref:Phage tail tape measure protein, lambda family n=1 Tax=Mariniphaga anaerophila TaxID=1484053 RepID=A0A831PSH1_9BACT|nr:hypothetical protein [Mariniphaga anaerophila]